MLTCNPFPCTDPAYRDCTIEAVESVTKDTYLCTLRLPAGTRMTVPTGHHVHIKHKVEGKDSHDI